MRTHNNLRMWTRYEEPSDRLIWEIPGLYGFTISFLFFFFLRFYLFLLRVEGEREIEKCQCVRETSMGCLSAHNPGMCPDWESNQWPFGSQVGAQSTELHQPGHKLPFKIEWGIALTGLWTDRLLVQFPGAHNPGPWLGVCQRQPTDASLTHQYFSLHLPLSLKINKQNL